jgi:hypothetical protein
MVTVIFKMTVTRVSASAAGVVTAPFGDVKSAFKGELREGDYR